MDLLTQGILGASLAQAAAPRREARLAAGIGCAAGLLADADALIRSSSDPLLVLEYHRHFTHALAFVPFGALVAAAIAWPLLRRRAAFPRIYLYALLGYAFSGLLDACTSYGTHLWWPFSGERVAWSIISLVDPAFTLLLAVPLATGIVRRWPGAARAGLALAACYLALGIVQHERAEAMARALAAERGHRPERMLVKPTLGNLVLWRSLYVVDGRVHVDGLRAGMPGGTRVYPGESVGLLQPSRDLAWAPPGSRARIETERFIALSDGYAARDPRRPDFIGDVRYALLPTSAEPLWGIVIESGLPDRGVRFVTQRSLTPEVRRRFTDMLLGR
ncbi:MAG TPA: metal-dependent hydrolase [Burkholderiales bacterium]|nr:metal-dependent hydrolase [Burkholderiales bacterium]